MKRYSLSALLLTIAALSILMALAIQYPGSMILACSFIPIFLIFRYVKLDGGPAEKLKLIALLALASIPPYLAVGPAISGGSP